MNMVRISPSLRSRYSRSWHDCWFVRFAPVALALFQLGCTQAPLPVPDTRADDEKAIREGEAQWAKEMAAKDVEKSVSHYADGASLLMPNMAIHTGKDAIHSM